MELIDKAAIVAEIEKRIKKYATIDVGNSNELEALYGAKCKALMEILSFLNTIEEKEVDLEKEINKYISDNFFGSETMGFFAVRTKEEPNDIDIALCAKYFYKLGLKAKGE